MEHNKGKMLHIASYYVYLGNLDKKIPVFITLRHKEFLVTFVFTVNSNT